MSRQFYEDKDNYDDDDHGVVVTMVVLIIFLGH
jgi:hypothetical protein